jgi:hypothetical protein
MHHLKSKITIQTGENMKTIRLLFAIALVLITLCASSFADNECVTQCEAQKAECISLATAQYQQCTTNATQQFEYCKWAAQETFDQWWDYYYCDFNPNSSQCQAFVENLAGDMWNCEYLNQCQLNTCSTSAYENFSLCNVDCDEICSY